MFGVTQMLRGSAICAVGFLVALGTVSFGWLTPGPTVKPGEYWYERTRATLELFKVFGLIGAVGAPAFLAGGLGALLTPMVGWVAVVLVAIVQVFVVRAALRRWPVVTVDLAFWDEGARIGDHDRRSSIRLLLLALAFVGFVVVLLILNQQVRPG